MTKKLFSLAAIIALVGCAPAVTFTVPTGSNRGSYDAKVFYQGIGFAANDVLSPNTPSILDQADWKTADANSDGKVTVPEVNRFFLSQREPEIRIQWSKIGMISGITAGVVLGYLFYVGRKLSNEVVYPRRTLSSSADQTFYAGAMPAIRVAYIYTPAAVQTDKAVILCHRLGATKEAMLPYQALLKDYNVLAFDFRNHGASEGKQTSGGYLEGEDVGAAIAVARSFGNRRIGILGIGMGAVAGLNAAAKDQEIAGVVAEGAYAGLEDEFIFRAQAHHYPLAESAAKVAKSITASRTGAGDKLDSGDARNQVAKMAGRPVLYIRDDRLALQASFENLFELAPQFKEPMVKFAASGTGIPDGEYEERVRTFFRYALLAP
ncbi:MAG: hypothetical protein HY692_07900, partial [Cyanobacteria bacterium NC_groundwater_1444_Ag_S-0.65um_54_12]|nr:hypothetical protein [Cyanobacteria bacterium NC_groundwater_1444_Ag_S-0.65um_54_12]